ncbi:MAG: c-type cytochrome [Acidimicrobiia bacterium]|nr:c-type cytochrome [Acidimicrobiia bacterium]
MSCRQRVVTPAGALLAALLLATAASLAAPSPATAATTAQPPAGASPDGETLFLTSCAGCHGPEGQGTDQGPTLVGVGAAAADFMLRTGRMPLASPTPQSPSKPPAYDDAEIEALVEHVAGFGDGPAVPVVDLESADLQLGGELYRANCAACHTASGIGGALSLGREAPSLHHVGPVQIAEAARIGPGQMPVFSPDTFDDHELDSIVRYVLYLAEPESPGGAALGGAGPIPEGFVAVLGGLGILVLVARWITRERPRPETSSPTGATAASGDPLGPSGPPAGVEPPAPAAAPATEPATTEPATTEPATTEPATGTASSSEEPVHHG